ncbi:hypothetical protein [Ruminococcus albus]|nr:hypothetical protein [Ruminococcus albus]MCC3351475.1 hypothetical protein [Ruminococcus albus 8]
MPYNALGDLYKIEVVKRLQKMGCNIKSVHVLNLILEKMGILIHSGDHWLTSKEGVKYTIYRSQVVDVDAWHPSIVDAVFEYLQNNGKA